MGVYLDTRNIFILIFGLDSHLRSVLCTFLWLPPSVIKQHRNAMWGSKKSLGLGARPEDPNTLTPGTAMVYICCLVIIIKNIPFHSQKFLSLRCKF